MDKGVTSDLILLLTQEAELLSVSWCVIYTNGLVCSFFLSFIFPSFLSFSPFSFVFLFLLFW